MNEAQKTSSTWLARIWPLAPVVAALLFTSGLLLLFSASPREAYAAMLSGAFGGSDKFLSVVAFWVPLVLCSVY